MRKIIQFIVLLFMALTWISCGKDEDQAGRCVVGEFQYLMIGSFYGECIGDGCIQIYKIDTEHLYEDTLDLYPNGQEPYLGSFIRLDDAKYELVKDIVDQFPNGLLQEEQTIIGMPDAGDWGGKYVEWKTVGSTPRFWLLDNMESNMPDVYNEFVDRIEEKLILLNP